MSAILFGSISTVADTSELQRKAFNQAFAAHGLDWQWDRDDYRSMLGTAGGQQRIAEYASSRGEDVDAAAVHRSKSSIFQDSIDGQHLSLRPGVLDTVQAAKGKGLKVGLVTTTSPDNISALMASLAPALSADDFDVVVDSTSVSSPKPDGAAYSYALDTLGEQADACVAIEDNTDGVAAAAAAGVTCVAFPNENTAGGDFDRAREVVDSLDFDALQASIPSA